MNRLQRIGIVGLSAFAVALVVSTGTSVGKTARFPINFTASMSGETIYFAPAGMEPDFDLVNRVIISTKLRTKGLPPVRLILDAYLENFQSDTQPVLPDLIHPNRQLSTTLGGFFSGEALIVTTHNRVLYSGTMLAEALIQPLCLTLPPNTKHAPPECLSETQHMYVYLLGRGPARGSSITTRSWFTGNQKLQVTAGHMYGRAHITAKARRLLKQGTGTLTKRQILNDFNVQFPHQMGRGAGQGQTGPTGTNCFMQHCINPTRSQPGGSTKPTNLGSDTSRVQSEPGIRWTMVVGFALIGLALALLVVYFWQGQRDKRRSQIAES